MSEVKLRGLAELNNALKALPDKIQQNVLRGSMRAGAKVLAGGIKILAPRGKTGRLARSVKYSSRYDRKVSRVVGQASAGRGTPSRKKAESAFYARFVEFGTAPHAISVKPPRKMLAIGVPSVKHPGSRANPFVQAAFRGMRLNAIGAAADYIRKRLRTKHGIDIPDIEGDLERSP